MKKILLYGLDSEKTKITEEVASEFGIELNKINKDNLEEKVGKLFEEDLRKNEGLEAEEKLMVFSDMDREELRDFLLSLKEKGVMVDHKCVLTKTNAEWTFGFLMGHIADEHRVVTKFRELGGLVKIALDKLEKEADQDLKNLVDRAMENRDRELDEERIDKDIRDLKDKLNIK
ncbi:DUF3783 domain-containing protein [Peptoniphilus harei]|uniref:DUF3783 domain-containing protein n=1 Tax=Peptoniphilus harei TaxID=54005 RepID=A0A943SNV7_9FIRM|nr:DUF3783 domain-containing protein [Peptoniphilus harei]MBS6534206.1 DUF3783 domain-containing protein [Peptoniphilus harei]